MLTGNSDSLVSDGVCGQNTSSHAQFFSVLSCRACLSHFGPRPKMFTGVVLSLCALKKPSHPTACFTGHFREYLTPSHRFAPRLHRRHPTSRPLTGIRSTLCATAAEGRQSGYLAKPLPHTGYESKSCIDVSSEPTPINYSSRRNSINIENDLTTTVAASENSDGFHQQAAASGSSQHAPASEVNPWLSGDMWSSTRKLVC